MEKNIFEKILDGESSCTKVYENDYVLAFHDIHPQAPVHILIIPKKKSLLNIANVSQEDKDLLAEMLFAAQHIAKLQGIEEGYRIVTNSGKLAGQIVPHLHLHVLGGKVLGNIC